MGRRGVIASKQYRTEHNVLRFWIHEGAYDRETPRRFSLETTVDGTLLSDYGFHEGDRLIIVGNVKLTNEQLITLRNMQADNDYDYMFSDGINLWEVLLQRITVQQKGNHGVAAITMNVVEKVV